MTQTASKGADMKPVLLSLTIIFTFFGISHSADNLPQKRRLLQDRHEIAGLSCTDCHAETPAGKPVPSARCIDCHGDYTALAPLTRKTEPNPHDHHEGTLDCARCHHVHVESEDYCLECHSWGYRVP